MKELHTIIDSIKHSNNLHLQLKSVQTNEEKSIKLSPYIYISPEHDSILIETNNKQMYKQFIDNGKAVCCMIYPYYSSEETITLTNNNSIPVMYKEVTTKQEYELLKSLDQFHYMNVKPSWGRQVYIIAKPLIKEILGTPLPDILGALILSSPSLFSGPRNQTLHWLDREVLKTNIDRVVRIARVTVHPEFRSLGIGQSLVKNSIAYSRDRWNVKGKKAWFVETVAEMSRFHPVFEKAGLKFIGHTKQQNEAHYWDNDSKKLGINQGPGNLMASLKRFKQKTHSSKPYFLISLLTDDHELTAKVNESSKELTNRHVFNNDTKTNNQPIIITNTDVIYNNFDSWNKPIELLNSLTNHNNSTLNELREHTNMLQKLLVSLPSNLKEEIDFNLINEYGIDNSKIKKLLDSIKNMIHDKTNLLINSRNDILEEIQNRINFIQTDIQQLNNNAVDHLHENHQPRILSVQKGKLNKQRVEYLQIEEQLNYGYISDRQKWIRDAFGLATAHRNIIFKNINLEIPPGDIVLVTGPSGSGKSSFLSILKEENISSGVIHPNGIKNLVACLDLYFDPTATIIDLVGENLEEALYLLNLVGLSEAHIYLKKRDELSHGQRYRAAFAIMLSQRKPIWIADEFCAFLDPITTINLCKGVRKLVKNLGITFVAASAKTDYLIDSLIPDMMITTNTGMMIKPNPSHSSWPKTPHINEIINYLLEKKLPPIPLIKWFVINGWLKEDDQNMTGVSWNENNFTIEKLILDLWSTDWVFHRMWNHYRKENTVLEYSHWESIFKNIPASQIYKRYVLLNQLIQL